MSWLYIVTAYIRVSNSFSLFANSLMSSLYIRWLIFSSDLLRCMWFSSIIAIMNCNRDNACPWNILLWVFASAKLFPAAVNFTLQVFIVFYIKCMTSSDILYILKQFIIYLCGTISYAFYSQSRPLLDFPSCLALVEDLLLLVVEVEVVVRVVWEIIIMIKMISWNSIWNRVLDKTL